MKTIRLDAYLKFLQKMPRCLLTNLYRPCIPHTRFHTSLQGKLPTEGTHAYMWIEKQITRHSSPADRQLLSSLWPRDWSRVLIKRVEGACVLARAFTQGCYHNIELDVVLGKNTAKINTS